MNAPHRYANFDAVEFGVHLTAVASLLHCRTMRALSKRLEREGVLIEPELLQQIADGRVVPPYPLVGTLAAITPNRSRAFFEEAFDESTQALLAQKPQEAHRRA